MGATEFDCLTPNIYVDGVLNTNLKLLMIEDNVGEQPSRAIFHYVMARDAIGPVTMIEMYPNGLSVAYGQRVTVQVPGTTRVIFNGWIMKRSDQGGPDKIIIQALCDKFLLQYMPVHGCLVRDVDEDLRYSARHNTRFNPEGAWNCTGYEIDHPTYGLITVPVFTPNAYRGSTYEAPDEAFSATLPTDGTHTAWTPRRALQYICFWSQFYAWLGELPYGMDGTEVAFLKDAGPLTWDYGSIAAMLGSDPDGAPTDPLDRKLQDISVQGRTMASAMNALFAATSCYTFRALYQDAASPDPATLTGTSLIQPVDNGWAAQGVGDPVTIQRSGYVGEADCDCNDFMFDEDASSIAENVLVLGDVKKIETRLEFKRAQGSGEYDEDTTSSLLPAWTKAQEDAFRYCIHGGEYGSAADDYAWMPKTFGSTTEFWPCNGSNGTAIIYARTAEAISMAWSNFPAVYKAWRINGYNTAVQDAITSTSDGLSGGLKAARPILPEQLQYMVNELSSSNDGRMFAKLPIRAEIAFDDPGYADSDREWQEVPLDLSARMTGDGTIWIDGLASIDPSLPYALIPFNLTDVDQHTAIANDGVKRMRINLAFPSDYRTRGTSSKTASSIVGTIRTAFDGMPLLRFADCQGMFRDERQVDSYPAAVPSVYGGTTGTDEDAMPLNRQLPPGSEQIHAQYAATRITARSVNPRRAFSFKLMGIRTAWRAGGRVSYIDFIDQLPIGGGTPYNWQYNLSAPITNVTHDFINQITSVGGVATEFGAGRI